MDWNKIQKNVGDVVTDAVRDFIDEQCEETAFLAKEMQRKKDIKNTIMALIKVKQDDITIYNLLNEYFEIENISEAETIVREARISYQIIGLRKYLTGKGMKVHEFRELARECKLEEKLSENAQLRTMPIEKLDIVIRKK